MKQMKHRIDIYLSAYVGRKRSRAEFMCPDLGMSW